ncbi:MAG: hypothetical protein QM572_10345 [Nocardioides sp.]|uniref:hypothetical protein n=1 Tax=Nocardioides sp. TaxID=35761 RepID=UPI0039E71658
MFGLGFFATVGSVVAGATIATVTVVGVVNTTVDSAPPSAGNVSKATTIAYGTR